MSPKAIFFVIGGAIGGIIGVIGSIFSFANQNYLLAGIFALLLIIGLILFGFAFTD